MKDKETGQKKGPKQSPKSISLAHKILFLAGVLIGLRGPLFLGALCHRPARTPCEPGLIYLKHSLLDIHRIMMWLPIKHLAWKAQ